jgi:hypothetical protein
MAERMEMKSEEGCNKILLNEPREKIAKSDMFIR